MTTDCAALYSGHRYPAAVIAHAVWLDFRFPLSLRMVEKMLTERGTVVSHETIRRWGLKFGRAYAAEIRRRQSMTGDKWHLDEVVISIAGKTSPPVLIATHDRIRPKSGLTAPPNSRREWPWAAACTSAQNNLTMPCELIPAAA